MNMNSQYSHKSPTLSQDKTFPNSNEYLYPASSYPSPSRRQDSSDPAFASHQYLSPKRFHIDVNSRPVKVFSKDPLQDAIDATYFRYPLAPNHTSIEAWIHNTILAQFPDSPPSTKTLPLCEGDMKPSLHNRQQQQQSLLSTFVPPPSPSLQAHQNACQPLTNISPNPQRRKQPVHQTVEDVLPFTEDLHRGWKQTGSQLSPLPTLTTITSTPVPSLSKPPSQPLTLAPLSRLTRSTAAKRRRTTKEKVTRSTAPNNQSLPTSLQPITLQPRIAKSTKVERWTTMNPRRGPSREAKKDSKKAAEPSTISNQDEEDVLQGQRNRRRPRKQGSASLQGLESPNSQPTGQWPLSSMPERTIGASVQEHHPSPSQRGSPGQRNDNFSHRRRSGQDQPDMIFSAWSPRSNRHSPSNPPGKFTAPTLATPVRARKQQTTFVEAGPFIPGEESVFNGRTQRQLFPSQQSANSSPQKKLTAPQIRLNADLKGVSPSPAQKSQSSQGMKSSTPSGRSKAGSGKTFTQNATLDQIDMEYLATCDPSIELQSPTLVRKHIPQLPTMVGNFQKMWAEIPRKFVPHQLKDYYERLKLGDTPETPRVEDFLEGHYAEFHHKQLETLARLVSQIVTRAHENHNTDTHERHWGASTVSPLLNEIVLWPHQNDDRENAYDIEAYNIENCAIEMQAYFIVRSNQNNQTITPVEPGSATDSITKMIDWSLALKLNEVEQADTNEAFRHLMDYERALNQTIRWYKNKPAFVDFEIKSEMSRVKPLVQLAVWAGGLYLKRRHHNWSTDAPSLGVSVVGAEWSLYVTFERVPGKLIMMGPFKLGSTQDLRGAWEIVFKLKVIANWGWTTFRPWFKDNIINWCRWKAEKPLFNLLSAPEPEQEQKQDAAKEALIKQWMNSEGQRSIPGSPAQEGIQSEFGPAR